MKNSTNFFSLLLPYLVAADISMTISLTDDGRLLVSFLPKMKMQDKVKEQIAPIMIKGTVDELDEKLMDIIGEPLKKSNAFAVDMQKFEIEMEKARLDSQKVRKEKEEREKMEKEADKFLKKAEELSKEGKHEQAYQEAKKAVEFLPDYQKAISKTEEMKKQAGLHNQISMFQP